MAASTTNEKLKKDRGCPCGEDCCDKPDVTSGSCDCVEGTKKEPCYCSENYQRICLTCGGSCFCEE